MSERPTPPTQDGQPPDLTIEYLPIDSSSEPESHSSPRPVRLHRVTAVSFQGPLPPPQVLGSYDKVIENGAERLFRAFEQQTEHRQELERKVILTNISLQIRGFYAALFLASITIAGGFWLAYLGKSLAGLAAIIGALASLLTVFLTGRTRQATERQEKVPKAR